jgi:hypothetical protein
MGESGAPEGASTSRSVGTGHADLCRDSLGLVPSSNARLECLAHLQERRLGGRVGRLAIKRVRFTLGAFALAAAAVSFVSYFNTEHNRWEPA